MTIEEVSVAALADALDAGHRVVDVREADEYTSGHVPGAVHVALGTVPQHVEAFRSPEGVTTYVICKAGGRSMQAAQFLAQQGVTTVNVAGGTMAWVQSGRAVVVGDQPS
jgi:rhodanese-related sulfurtransferase